MTNTDTTRNVQMLASVTSALAQAHFQLRTVEASVKAELRALEDQTTFSDDDLTRMGSLRADIKSLRGARQGIQIASANTGAITTD